MDIKTLDSLAERISQVRADKVSIEEKVKAARAALEEKMANHLRALELADQTEEDLRNQMVQALKEANKDNWKTEKVSISVGSSTTFKVVDPEATIAWLKEKDLDKEYTETVVKSTIKGVLEQRYNDKEVVPGTQASTKDFVKVVDRKPKAEKGE